MSDRMATNENKESKINLKNYHISKIDFLTDESIHDKVLSVEIIPTITKIVLRVEDPDSILKIFELAKAEYRSCNHKTDYEIDVYNGKLRIINDMYSFSIKGIDLLDGSEHVVEEKSVGYIDAARINISTADDK